MTTQSERHIPADIFAIARTLADDAANFGYTQAALDIARAILAERERCIEVAKSAGNFGDYRRDELTADYGQPRFDMMNEIISAIDNPHSATPPPPGETDKAGEVFLLPTSPAANSHSLPPVPLTAADSPALEPLPAPGTHSIAGV